MKDMSFINYVLVSFPEQIIFLFLGILAIGKSSYLKTRSNYYRILTSACIMTVSSYLIRKQLGIETESTIVLLFIDVFLLIYIMRFKFYESITATIFSFLLLILIELPVSLLIGPIMGVRNEQDLYQNVNRLFIIVSIIRIIQILLVYLFYRFNFKIINMERSGIKRKEYYIQLTVYLISICTLAFLAFIMTKILLFNNDMSITSSNIYLLRMNIYISLFVTVILTLAVRGVYEFYKNKSVLNNNEVVQSLEYIYSLLDDQNYKEAKDALNSLKDHISKH